MSYEYDSVCLSVSLSGENAIKKVSINGLFRS